MECLSLNLFLSLCTLFSSYLCSPSFENTDALNRNAYNTDNYRARLHNYSFAINVSVIYFFGPDSELCPSAESLTLQRQLFVVTFLFVCFLPRKYISTTVNWISFVLDWQSKSFEGCGLMELAVDIFQSPFFHLDHFFDHAINRQSN